MLLFHLIQNVYLYYFISTYTFISIYSKTLMKYLFVGTGETEEQLKLAHDLLHSGGTIFGL